MGGSSYMIDSGKVSVIIPVYNVENYLKDCLDSVVTQTYKNIEIIIIDDGSTDKSGEICKKYEAEYQNIKYIFQKNQGLSAARNTGLDACMGEYVYCLDSDDFIASNSIDVMVREIKKNGVDIVATGFLVINEERKYENDEIVSAEFHRETSKEFYLQIISNHACGKLYKRGLFDGVRYPVGQNYEDVATTHKLFYKANKITYTDEGFYYYRIRKGAITQTPTEKNITDFIKSYESVKNFYPIQHSKEIDYYLMTILYNIYSRLSRSDESLKKKYSAYINKEFREFDKVSLREYLGAPMTLKLYLYKLGLASLFMKVFDIERKAKEYILRYE